jgi:hypothetical protein
MVTGTIQLLQGPTKIARLVYGHFLSVRVYCAALPSFHCGSNGKVSSAAIHHDRSDFLCRPLDEYSTVRRIVGGFLTSDVAADAIEKPQLEGGVWSTLLFMKGLLLQHS